MSLMFSTAPLLLDACSCMTYACVRRVARCAGPQRPEELVGVYLMVLSSQAHRTLQSIIELHALRTTALCKPCLLREGPFPDAAGLAH